DAVIFLDMDQHLLAPRHRAGEEALALIALAARKVMRSNRGRLLIQTREPDHPVLSAVTHADPERFSGPELELRRALRLPPVTSVALVSGTGAAEFIDSLGPHDGVEVLGPLEGVWRLRAEGHEVLCDVLASTPRP